jgi:anti-sigma factor RsiW
MNCKDWEERIAMSASGDLSPEPRAEVERHLAECGECRGFAQGIEDSLALLRSAHEEAIAAGHYAAVRARVQDRMARERRSAWRRWVWAPAFVAAGLALVGVFLTKRPGERPKVYVAEVRPRVAQEVPVRPVEPVTPRAVQRRPRIRRRVAPEPQPPVEPLVIKLITDDPNVVIYWFADGKGEAQ